MWTKPFARFAMWLSIGSALYPAVSSALPCSSLPNPVYIAGSTAVEPLVKPIAQLLARTDPMKLSLIWQLQSSCNGAEAVVRDTLPASCAPGGACITGKALFWTLDPRDMLPGECDLDPKGTKVDIAVSDVAPATCPGLVGVSTQNVIDIPGAVSAYALVMAAPAGETAIQAEEAHFVFGAGKSAGVAPWQNDAVIALSGVNNAGLLIVGPQIKLPPHNWKGSPAVTPDAVVTMLYDDPASGIGILPTTLADKQRGMVKELAFQAIKQRGAFYPDRRATTFDKQNVRDGHYPLWGYMHLLLRGVPGNPTKPLSDNGARIADLLLGRSPVAGMDTLTLQVKAGFIPQCAMKVTRANDQAPLAFLATPEPCHCWFEKTVPSGTLSCQECLDGKTCASGKCRRNLCEVQ